MKDQGNTLSVLIEEYKVRSAEISHRSGLMHKSIQLELLFIGAILTYFINNYSPSNAQPALLSQPIALLFPMIFFIFGISYSRHDFIIAVNAEYINRHLTPALRTITGDEIPMNWESLLKKRRQQINTICAEEISIHFILPSVIYIFAAANQQSYSITTLLLLTFNLILFRFFIREWRTTRRLYSNI